MDYKVIKPADPSKFLVTMDDGFQTELELMSCLALTLGLARKAGVTKVTLEIDLSDASPDALSGIAVGLEEAELDDED